MIVHNMTKIKKEVMVNASQETSFKVFTEQIDLWWPSTHHIGKTPVTETILEPAVKGRWYTKHEDGNECNVGTVIEWNPYDLVVLGWQINGHYQYDPELITEVVVRFIAEGPKKTRVEFEHQNLQRMGGTKANEMDEGWGMILERYKSHVNSTERGIE